MKVFLMVIMMACVSLLSTSDLMAEPKAEAKVGPVSSELLHLRLHFERQHYQIHRQLGRTPQVQDGMVRPTIRDQYIMPFVDDMVGECFFNMESYILHNGYELAGSPVLGRIVAMICDPVNEMISICAGTECRHKIEGLHTRGLSLRSRPWAMHDSWGMGSAYGVQVSLLF